MSLRHWLQLSLTDGIGPILLTRLIEAAAGDVERAAGADAAVLRNVDGVGSAGATKIAASLKQAAKLVDDEVERADRAGASIVSRDDERFPPLLRLIPDPPAVLYVKGDLQPRDLNSIAIVGSRKCSFYGREQAERFAALLAGAAITVVSGGARGVDSSAHRGAIAHAQGRTLAVLGCGVDIAYPPENAELFAQISAGRGAIISEYSMGAPPIATNFPRRNRIVSGMSRGVLVIEADERSGALITARQAGDDHGRPVFAIPGRVDNPLSLGPHKLIRDGATLVTSLEDILEGLDPLPHEIHVIPSRVTDPVLFEPVAVPLQAEHSLNVVEGMSDDQRAIFDRLDGDALEVETIIDRCGLPAHIVMQALTFLTLRGAVKRVDGQRFARRRDAREARS